MSKADRQFYQPPNPGKSFSQSAVPELPRALSYELHPRKSVPPSLEPSQNSDWETVTFPHAIDVDSLPTAVDPSEDGTIFQERTMTEYFQTPESNPVSESSTQLVQALHDCNRDLISRVTELEAELENCRNTMQEKEVLLSQQSQEFDLAQQQVTRLFSKLELSNQVIRRQQVLVETLTEQWETSQARMAQMERECAAAQQSYNEKLNELAQTQNTSEELRSRLHRQQRHTLQFKAALERCLEMQHPHAAPTSGLQQPAALTSSHSPQSISGSGDWVKTEVITAADLHQSPSPRVISPAPLTKAQPVQPWSSESTNTVELGRLDELARVDMADDASFVLDSVDPSFNPEQPIQTWVDPESAPLAIQKISPEDLVTFDSYWHVEQGSPVFQGATAHEKLMLSSEPKIGLTILSYNLRRLNSIKSPQHFR
ncbi:MAG: hypothetical protein HC825_02980 [Oscillatoriales cyanobacterium RM1_1_9]|nr:hypothetical protein [Oscillatoriales cyanobacterium RM1_1_9]